MTVEHQSSLDTMKTPNDTKSPSSAEEGSASAPGKSTQAGRLATIRSWTRRCLARWRLAVGTILIVATVSVAVALYFVQYRPDRRIDDAAAHRAIQAASDGAVALLSYSYDSLDRDFANAKSHLTGDFLGYYDKFSKLGVAPTAQQGQLTATAKVVRAAVSELRPDSAVVLVFLNQTTTSKKKPEPLTTASRVLVTLTKINGSWLIAKFDPLG